MTVSTIYVYCDIVEPQIVGDRSAQLLKSIPVLGKFGDIIAKTFINIQCAPIRMKSFEVVEVLLRSDTGDPVPFRPGGEGGEGHPEGKFVRPTFFSQFGALISKMHVVRASRGAFGYNLKLKPRQST